jgi:NMD protein affecting ribosome stability and mRNA decay
LGLKKGQTNSGSFQKEEHRSRKTEFRPGQIPHNKGVLASPELRAKNSAAQKKRFEKIKLTGPCIQCGSKTTYVRPNGRAEWYNSENGDVCKKCWTKDYSSRVWKRTPKIKLTGPCVRCGSESTYREKSGYFHWHKATEGTICRRCYGREHDGKIKNGLCAQCGITETRGHWLNSEKGQICPACYKKNRKDFEFPGLCIQCGATKTKNSWHNTLKGRICRKCSGHNRAMKFKIETFRKYSPHKIECTICGFDEIDGLELDHIGGKGSIDRAKHGLTGGWRFYQKLQQLGYPPGFQVLCATHNRIKQIREDDKNLPKNRSEAIELI